MYYKLKECFWLFALFQKSSCSSHMKIFSQRIYYLKSDSVILQNEIFYLLGYFFSLIKKKSLQ